MEIVSRKQPETHLKADQRSKSMTELVNKDSILFCCRSTEAFKYSKSVLYVLSIIPASLFFEFLLIFGGLLQKVFGLR